MNWDILQEKFYNFILENNVIGFFKDPLKLKSGRISYWYVNWRNVAENVFLIDKLGDFVISFVKSMNLSPECFYGVPEGATKLGIITQYKWVIQQKQGCPILSMGRAKPKEHGDPKDRYFLGVPTGKVVILEDVTTTGGSLLETIENLKKINVEITGAIGITNRNELRDDDRSVEDAVNNLGIPYYAMSNALDLLPKAYEKFQPGKEIAMQVESYFKEFGIKEIKLL